MDNLLKIATIKLLQNEDTKIVDVDYSGFTDDPESKPTTVTIVCDISAIPVDLP